MYFKGSSWIERVWGFWSELLLMEISFKFLIVRATKNTSKRK